MLVINLLAKMGVCEKMSLFHRYLFQKWPKFWGNEASRSAAAQSVAVKSTGCGFDPHSTKLNIYLHLYFHFFALV